MAQMIRKIESNGGIHVFAFIDGEGEIRNGWYDSYKERMYDGEREYNVSKGTETTEQIISFFAKSWERLREGETVLNGTNP